MKFPINNLKFIFHGIGNSVEDGTGRERESECVGNI